MLPLLVTLWGGGVSRAVANIKCSSGHKRGFSDWTYGGILTPLQIITPNLPFGFCSPGFNMFSDTREVINCSDTHWETVHNLGASLYR